MTQHGLIKRFERKELTPWRTYKSKSIKYAKLKDIDDRIVAIAPIIMEDLLLVTQQGYALRFSSQEIPIQGLKAAGVKGINLKAQDYLVSACPVNADSFFVLTQRGALKRVAIADIPQTSRANRGLPVLRELKTKPHRVFLAGMVKGDTTTGTIDLFTHDSEDTASDQQLEVISKTGQQYQLALNSLSLSDRTSNGSFISESISDQEVAAARLI